MAAVLRFINKRSLFNHTWPIYNVTVDKNITHKIWQLPSLVAVQTNSHKCFHVSRCQGARPDLSLVGKMEKAEAQGHLSLQESFIWLNDLIVLLKRGEGSEDIVDKVWSSLISLGVSFRPEHFKLMVLARQINKEHVTAAYVMSEVHKAGLPMSQGIWETLLEVCLFSEDVQGTETILTEMKNNDHPINENIFALLMKYYIIKGDEDGMNAVTSNMESLELQFGLQGLTKILEGHATKGDMSAIRSILSEYQSTFHQSFQPFASVYCTLIENNFREEAGKFLASCSDYSRSWNLCQKSIAKLWFFLRQGYTEQAFRLMIWMSKNMEGLPNYFEKEFFKVALRSQVPAKDILKKRMALNKINDEVRYFSLQDLLIEVKTFGRFDVLFQAFPQASKARPSERNIFQTILFNMSIEDIYAGLSTISPDDVQHIYPLSSVVFALRSKGEELLDIDQSFKKMNFSRKCEKILLDCPKEAVENTFPFILKQENGWNLIIYILWKFTGFKKQECVELLLNNLRRTQLEPLPDDRSEVAVLKRLSKVLVSVVDGDFSAAEVTLDSAFVDPETPVTNSMKTCCHLIHQYALESDRDMQEIGKVCEKVTKLAGGVSASSMLYLIQKKEVGGKAFRVCLSYRNHMLLRLLSEVTDLVHLTIGTSNFEKLKDICCTFYGKSACHLALAYAYLIKKNWSEAEQILQVDGLEGDEMVFQQICRKLNSTFDKTRLEHFLKITKHLNLKTPDEILNPLPLPQEDRENIETLQAAFRAQKAKEAYKVIQRISQEQGTLTKSQLLQYLSLRENQNRRNKALLWLAEVLSKNGDTQNLFQLFFEAPIHLEKQIAQMLWNTASQWDKFDELITLFGDQPELMTKFVSKRNLHTLAQSNKAAFERIESMIMASEKDTLLLQSLAEYYLQTGQSKKLQECIQGRVREINPAVILRNGHGILLDPINHSKISQARLNNMEESFKVVFELVRVEDRDRLPSVYEHAIFVKLRQRDFLSAVSYFAQCMSDGFTLRDINHRTLSLLKRELLKQSLPLPWTMEAMESRNKPGVILNVEADSSSSDSSSSDEEGDLSPHSVEHSRETSES